MTICSANLFDGTASTPAAVTLECVPEGVLVAFADGTVRTVRYHEIRRLEKVADGFRCLIPPVLSDHPEGALHFSNDEVYQKLRSRLIALRPPIHRALAAVGTLKPWQLFVLVVALLAVFVTALYVAVMQAYKVTPVAYDYHLGRRVDSTWLRFYEPCNTPALDTFLARSVRTLALPTDRFDHRVIVINDSMENAFCLPGGTIYLFRGLIEKSHDPDAVLGVISHEIAHAECRHTVRQIIQNMSITYLISLSFGMAIDNFDLLDGLEKTMEMSSVLFMLRYSRAFEREADSLAIVRMHAAGLRVGSLDSLLIRLTPKPRKRDRLLAVFSTHPETALRTKKFEAARAMETFPQDTVFALERATWDKIKKGCPPPADTVPLWKKAVRRKRPGAVTDHKPERKPDGTKEYT